MSGQPGGLDRLLPSVTQEEKLPGPRGPLQEGLPHFTVSQKTISRFENHICVTRRSQRCSAASPKQLPKSRELLPTNRTSELSPAPRPRRRRPDPQERSQEKV